MEGIKSAQQEDIKCGCTYIHSKYVLCRAGEIEYITQKIIEKIYLKGSRGIRKILWS